MSIESGQMGLAIILAMACAAVETVEQLLYRIAGRDKRRWWSHVGMAMLLHACYVIAWMLLLRIVPLSTALPMMGLQYVTIALAAKLLFNEPVDLRRWLGIIVIVAGFILVAAHMKG